MKTKLTTAFVAVALFVGLLYERTVAQNAVPPVPQANGQQTVAPPVGNAANAAPQQMQQDQQIVPNAAAQIAGNVAAGNQGEGKLMELPLPDPIEFEAGKLKGWKVKIPGNRPLATPAVKDGLLFVGGGFGSYEFYTLDAKTGKRKWTFKCGDDGPTAAVVAEGCVAYNTESCTIYVQDVVTGKVHWHRWLGDPLMSQPAIGGGKVFMVYPGQGGHRLAAFGLKDGKVAWEKKITAEIITAPVVAGDFVVAATVDGTLHKFNIATGELAWQKKYNVTSAPRVLGDTIFISQRTEKKIQLTDDKGKKKESTVTLEGLNLVALDTGKLVHDQPLAAVKASFLLRLADQRGLFSANAGLQFQGQHSYRSSFNKSRQALAGIAKGQNVVLKQLAERISKFEQRKPTEDAAGGEKDADEALALATDLDKSIAALANDESVDKNELKSLKAIASEIRDKADKTKDAAEAAKQAEVTVSATEAQQAEDQEQDAAVGFSDAPAAAQLGLAANIGQVNVKAVWAYQGSRPCLYKGTSIMVLGRKMRAVDTKTGEVVWSHEFDFNKKATRPVTPPVLAGDKIYVGTADGRILCHEAHTGKSVWNAKVGGRILFEPAVVGGCVYAATADGTVICLNTNDPTADGWHMWGGSAKHNGAE